MNTLIEIQRHFQDHLLHSNNDIIQDILTTEKFTAHERLSVYSNAYSSRLIEALSANYSALHIYLGDEQFEELSIAYVKQHPSCHRSIRWFGHHLSQFLNEHLPYMDFPFLAELAKFEWVMTLAFDAENKTILSLDGMQSIPPEAWENMHLVVHPSVNILNLYWNVASIWESTFSDETPPEPSKNEHPLNWIVWRDNLISHYCSLEKEEAYALNALLKGLSFGQVCEGLCQWIDEQEVAVYAASLLKGWDILRFNYRHSILKGIIVCSKIKA